MFKQMIENFHNLKDHHQILLTIIIALSAISVTWGVEKLLELYFFPNKAGVRYILAVVGGLLMLWFIKHSLLHEI